MAALPYKIAAKHGTVSTAVRLVSWSHHEKLTSIYSLSRSFTSKKINRHCYLNVCSEHSQTGVDMYG